MTISLKQVDIDIYGPIVTTNQKPTTDKQKTKHKKRNLNITVKKIIRPQGKRD